MVAKTKTRSFFYSRNNKIVVKLNNIILVEEIKRQASKQVVQKTNAYLIKNTIITTRLRIAWALPSGDIVI